VIVLKASHLILKPYILSYKIRKYIKDCQNKSIERVKDMKKRGEMHEWVTMNIAGIDRRICKKTYYIPSLNSFLNKESFEALQENQKKIKEYKDYTEKRMSEICEKYDVTKERLDSILQDISDMPVDYLKTRGIDVQR
jgi:hypothetical protein